MLSTLRSRVKQWGKTSYRGHIEAQSWRMRKVHACTGGVMEILGWENCFTKTQSHLKNVLDDTTLAWNQIMEIYQRCIEIKLEAYEKYYFLALFLYHIWLPKVTCVEPRVLPLDAHYSQVLKHFTCHFGTFTIHFCSIFSIW